MPVGIQIFNQGSVVQIDSEFRNPLFIGKGTVTLTVNDGSSPYGGWFKTIPVSGVNPMVAFGPTPGWSILPLGRNFVNGQWEFGIKAWNSSGAGQVTVTYYIFDTSPPTVSNAGIQVFDANGNLTFEGSREILRVQLVFQPTTSVLNASLPSGNWAFMVTFPRFVAIRTSEAPTFAIFGFGAELSSTLLKTSWVRTYFDVFGPEITNPAPLPPPLVVVDVSRL